MTSAKAKQMAADIRAYWARKGHTVVTDIVHEGQVDGVNTAGYTVRTDMVNGLPRTLQGRNPVKADAKQVAAVLS